jgi:hypothetical protein
MSDEGENMDSDDFQSEGNNNSKQGKKKIRVLGKRGYNKPKSKRVKYQSKNIFTKFSNLFLTNR